MQIIILIHFCCIYYTSANKYYTKQPKKYENKQTPEEQNDSISLPDLRIVLNIPGAA